MVKGFAVLHAVSWRAVQLEYAIVVFDIKTKGMVDVEFSCDVLSFFVHVACHTFRICMLDGVLGND